MVILDPGSIPGISTSFRKDDAGQAMTVAGESGSQSIVFRKAATFLEVDTLGTLPGPWEPVVKASRGEDVFHGYFHSVNSTFVPIHRVLIAHYADS